MAYRRNTFLIVINNELRIRNSMSNANNAVNNFVSIVVGRHSFYAMKVRANWWFASEMQQSRLQLFIAFDCVLHFPFDRVV